MKFYLKLILIAGVLIGGGDKNCLAMDVEKKETQCMTAYRLHKEILQDFALLNYLPINRVSLSEGDSITLLPQEIEIFKRMNGKCRKIFKLIPHLPIQLRSHLIIDLGNWSYYTQLHDGYTTLGKENLKFYDVAEKIEKKRPIDNYYLYSSVGNICRNELGKFKRFNDLNPFDVGHRALSSTNKAFKYALDIDAKINQLTNLMITGSIIQTNPTESSTHYPLTTSPLEFVESIYKKNIGTMDKVKSPVRDGFKSTYEFIKDTLTKNPHDKHKIQFIQDCLVTSLIDPKICTDYNEDLQKL